MVQHLVGGLEDALDLCKVHDPARLGIHVTAQVQFDAKRMSVQARALVALGHVREAVGGLNRENLENIHVPIVACRLSKPASVHRESLQ